MYPAQLGWDIYDMSKRIRLRVYRNKKRRLVFCITVILLVVVCAGSFYVYKNTFVQYGQSLFGGSVSSEKGPGRGTIYDRNYKELAISQVKVSLYARTREIQSREEVATNLATLLGKDKDELLMNLQGDALRVWLAKSLSKDQEIAVKTLGLKGVYIHREQQRYYPFLEQGAHLLGFTEDNIGLSGVEYHYNKLLNKYGVVNDLKSVQGEKGKASPADVDEYLVLTVDIKIQTILEKYLATIATIYPGRRSGAILMDCKTGGIIGAAHFPSYDPNRFRDYTQRILDNSLDEEIGIPFKLRKVLRDAALLRAEYDKSGVMLPWSVIAGTGSLGSQVRLWEELKLNDSLELDFVSSKAILNNNVHLLATGADPLGTVPEVVTPLHLLNALGPLVNSGDQIIPHVVEKFRSKWREEVFTGKSWDREHGGKVVPEEVSKEIVRLLKSHMRKGPLGAGILEEKSVTYREEGTSWVFDQNHLLISLVPADEPELFLLVSIEPETFGPLRQKRSQGIQLVKHTEKIIAPLFALQEVMKNLMDLRSVKVQEKDNFYQESKVVEKRLVDKEDGLEKRLKVMPDLRGLSLRKSLRLLQEFELDIEIQGTGRVVSQTPEAGKVLGSTKKCRLVLERVYAESE